MDNGILIILVFGLLLLIKFGLKSGINRINRNLTGAYGEWKVKSGLKRLGDCNYKILNDVLIQNNNYSSQLDHIVVSSYGIFVVETKNFKGWIFGHEKSEYWTHTIFRRKYQFRNPVKQVWGHINSLKRILNKFPSVPYYPIVVFVGSGKLKGITSNVPVISDNKLIRYIQNNSMDEVLSADEVEEIVNIISSSNLINNRLSIKEHIAKANANKSHRNAPKICTSCGGRLIIKNGKFGPFYGCSNYPSCKFTQTFK